MGFGALLGVLVLASLVYGVYQFVRAEKKTPEAMQTTAYIVLYPVVVYMMWRTGYGPPWLVAPVATAGIPWIVAGIHLNEIVKDPTLVRDNEFVGFPFGFWIWGGLLSLAAGLLID